MDMPDRPWEGGCRCDKLRFRITQSPLLTGACHCTGCQRMTGSAFSLTVTVPEDGFDLIAGEAVIGGMHGNQARHQHCGWCKSWVFTTVEPSMGFVNVRATMLDNATWFVPFVETFTSEKLSWVTTPASHSFAKFPEPEDYQRLTEAFASGRLR